MSLLNASEDFNSHSPRPRQRQSVEIGMRMQRTHSKSPKNSPRNKSPRKSPTLDPNRRMNRRRYNTRKRNQQKSPTKSNHDKQADRIRPKQRAHEPPDLSMPIMFEVDEEELSRSTYASKDKFSSSYHTAISNTSSRDRSRSRSRQGSSDMSSGSGPGVVGGKFSEDFFQFDDSIPASNEFQVPTSSEFQLDNVPETPEHQVKAMLKTGVDYSAEVPPSKTIPSLSPDDPSETSEEVEASEESPFEEQSDEEDEDSNESSDDEDNDDSEDSDDNEDESGSDEEGSDDDDDDEESSEEEESSSEEEPSEESEIAGADSSSVLPASMSASEKSEYTAPPPQARKLRMQMRDTGMPSEALQMSSPPIQARSRTPTQDFAGPPQEAFENSHELDTSPGQTQQRTRSRDRVGAPQNTMSLELDAPPAETRQRTRSQDRVRSLEDNSLQLDAPPTRQRQRMRSHDSHDSIDAANNSLQLDAPRTRQRQRVRSNESSDSFANSLELDAPPTRQRQRVKSNESNDSSFANSLELDAPPARQRQRMKSHESEETDEDEAADTISDLPMRAPRTRTRTRKKESKPDRMMSFEPFQIGNLSNDTLQMDSAPPQPQVGRIRTKARDRIMSVGPGMHDLPPDATPKVRMPPERRLSLDSRRHVYEEEGRTNPLGQRQAASSGASTSDDSLVTQSPPKKNKSLDEFEASPGTKNRRRLRSADDLEEIRMKSVEDPYDAVDAARARRTMFHRRTSGGRNPPATKTGSPPRREKAAYLLGMHTHQGSVLQGQELGVRNSGGNSQRSLGPMGARQPRQRPAPNRFKPLKPPPSNDDLDIDDMAAIRRFSERVSKRDSVESDDTMGEGSVDTMERGVAKPHRQRRRPHENSSRSTEMDQKDPSELDEKQFWLIVTFLTALGVIFGFVAVKVS